MVGNLKQICSNKAANYTHTHLWGDLLSLKEIVICWLCETKASAMGLKPPESLLNSIVTQWGKVPRGLRLMHAKYFLVCNEHRASSASNEATFPLCTQFRWNISPEWGPQIERQQRRGLMPYQSNFTKKKEGWILRPTHHFIFKNNIEGTFKHKLYSI